MGRGKKQVVVEEVEEEDGDEGRWWYQQKWQWLCCNSFQVPDTPFHNAIYNPPFTYNTLILVSVKYLRWLELLYQYNIYGVSEVQHLHSYFHTESEQNTGFFNEVTPGSFTACIRVFTCIIPTLLWILPTLN
jgi:hypothetical protein